MALRSTLRLTLSPAQRTALERLRRAHRTPQQLAARAWIILLAGAGKGVRETAHRGGRGQDGPVLATALARWQGRAQHRRPSGRRAALGCAGEFTAEQVRAIVALACEPPSLSGRPITPWSQSELAREAVRRGVQVPPRPEMTEEAKKAFVERARTILA